MNTPCHERIEMAVRARARAILRRIFQGPRPYRFTAEEHNWLRQHLPSVVTDTNLERALLLAGPDFDKAVGRYISEFYEPDEPSRVRELVLAALAIESVEDIRQ